MDDEVSVVAMNFPLVESVGLRAKRARWSVVEDRGYRAGLTQEREQLRRTWLLGVQKSGYVHAHVFNEPEACRWVLIQTARWILVNRSLGDRPRAPRRHHDPAACLLADRTPRPLFPGASGVPVRIGVRRLQAVGG